MAGRNLILSKKDRSGRKSNMDQSGGIETSFDIQQGLRCG
jgi:hypothetical protein